MISLCLRSSATHFVSPRETAISVEASMSENTIVTVPPSPASFATSGCSSSTAAATASIDVWRAAVESAGRLRAFGPLPDGYPADALTVYFAFDPNIIR